MQPQICLMKELVEYLIPYKGLSMGKHEYQFHVQDSFFKALKSESVEKGDLKVNLIIDKDSRLLIAHIFIKGTVKLVCDRCLDLFDFPIDVDYEQIYKYGDAPDQNIDDILYLPSNEYQLDVSKLILENILLQIPIRKVHPYDADGNPTCNMKQLELIDNYTKKHKTDPRWDVLKNIKFDD